MTYRAGELDQRITFQELIKTPDGLGGNTHTWSTVQGSDTWALVRSKNGREVTEFDRVNAEAGYLFVIRNRQDIQDSYRIMWDCEPFNIRVRRQPKKRALYLEIDAERGVAQ